MTLSKNAGEVAGVFENDTVVYCAILNCIVTRRSFTSICITYIASGPFCMTALTGINNLYYVFRITIILISN